MRRLAGFSRVHPIDVPTLGEREMKAEPEGLAGFDGVHFGDERHLGMRRLHLRAFERKRRLHTQEKEREREMKLGPGVFHALKAFRHEGA